MNEVAEELVRAERASVDEILEKLLLFRLPHRILEVMGLVQHAEFRHQPLVELGLLERRTGTADADAQEPRVAEVRLGEGVEVEEALILLLDREGARLREAVHEADA